MEKSWFFTKMNYNTLKYTCDFRSIKNNMEIGTKAGLSSQELTYLSERMYF